MLKTGFYLAVLFVLVTSCTKRSALKQYIHDADKVEVVLYSGNQPYVQSINTDIDTIKKWMNYISDSTATPGNCSLDGKLKFVQYEDSLILKFSTANGCTQVHYSINGKEYVQPLTKEGIQYINSLKKVQFN